MQAWIKNLISLHLAADARESSEALLQQVFQAIEQGDSCIMCSAEQAQQLQGVSISAEQAAAQIIAPFVFDGRLLYLYRYWALEHQLAQALLQLKQQRVQSVNLTAQHLALLSDGQQQLALQMVAEQGLSIITGGPGTGKTYTLARIIAVLNQAIPDIRIAMAAPTGKAAQRMKEALQNSFNDVKLQDLVSDNLTRLTPITIHRLLGLGEDQRPRFHAKRPLPYDVIVVDEASMLDLTLAKLLFSAIAPSTRLILLGDANQLASVDVGSVLADLQQVPLLAENRVNLITSHRFDGEKLIGRMADFIQQNETAQQVLMRFEQRIAPAGLLQAVALAADMQDVVQLQYLQEDLQRDHGSTALSAYYDQLMLGFKDYASALDVYLAAEQDEPSIKNIVHHFDDYRILAAVRHGGLGLTALNQHMEERILKQTQQSKAGDWYTGRPVMMTYNDYQLGLSNGDIGICFGRRQAGKINYSVYFPSLQKWVAAARLPKSMETAYAMTIHKSQGSEFRHTAVVLDANAEQLLSKELIYTAITRAKKAVSILAAPAALASAMTVKTVRTSGLIGQIVTKNDTLCQ
ncbi:exodeoxyribonuclease V subunit alpha [Acinetobacter sp. ANC 3813]|uniref:exodeoxyribonuclease V subunit alpha n=1 Tax=Acinetobacter sp. ANC 3813 TaxID=1977873 RepID=UPI000A338A50|nr:exodeoxyribonuclease V subunit alpha [Acinetobacter sp. ANC 3813]OTG87292.1 exodeoxyribonuclease V subunit alpha [Acinetobacter sp. ANC 3813]